MLDPGLRLVDGPSTPSTKQRNTAREAFGWSMARLPSWAAGIALAGPVETGMFDNIAQISGSWRFRDHSPNKG